MVELKNGSKLVSAEPNLKPKHKQKLQGCNVKALKNENLELKNKIVSLKNDFQKIIDEVRTLQLYVSDYDKKTKVKFSKIKMIVNILKKERELLHVQNKKFSDELKVLGEENESLRRLLGEVQMIKETKNEFFKKEEKKNENSKQSKIEEKKKKHEEQMEGKNIITLGKDLWKNINVLENADSNEREIYDYKILQGSIVIKTEPLLRKKKQKDGFKTNNVMHIIKCKKILKKKEIKNNINISIFKYKRFSLTPFSEYLNKYKILESYLYWNNLRKKGNSENLKNLKNLKNSENYLNKSSFLGQMYLSPEKRNIRLINKNCVFSNVSETQLANDNVEQEEKTIKIKGVFNTVSLTGKKQNVITTESEVETASINLDADEETKHSKEKEEVDDSKKTEEKEEKEEKEKKEEKEEKENALIIKNLNSKAVEWDVKNKQKECIVYSILRICQKLRKENFQKLQNKVNEHVSENVDCKQEKDFHFSKIENLISENKFYHFLSFSIDLFAKQIIDQDKKLNEFEMILNNINIFSHNLLDMLNESSYMKLKKKKKKHESILVAIRNILNECQLKN